MDRFEVSLAEYTGAKHAIAVVNGTCALQVALKLAGLQRNDEVLVPALSFIATANAVHYCGAIPHFVEIAEETLGMDPDALYDWLKQVAEPARSFPESKNRSPSSRLGPNAHFWTSLSSARAS